MKKRTINIILAVILITISGIAIYEYQRTYIGRVFDYIYNKGIWGRDGVGRGWSGAGSKVSTNIEYIKYVESFIVENSIKSVVDAGCGDWTFSKEINWQGAKYLGIDISNVVINHVKKYESDNIRFEVGDVTDNLPPADLLLCKDVLQHLPNKYIIRFIKNNLRPDKFRWAIITNDLLKSGENSDIKVGYHRMIDLSKAPFYVKGLINLPIRFGNDEYSLYKTAQKLQLTL